MPSNKSAERFRLLMEVLPDHIRQSAAKAVKQQSEDLAALMRRVVPVDKGVLRDSISAQQRNGPLNYKVMAGGSATTKKVRKDKKGRAPEYDYALAEEFGRRGAPAEPFFWPSYRLRRKAMRAAIRKSIVDEIKKSSGT